MIGYPVAENHSDFRKQRDFQIFCKSFTRFFYKQHFYKQRQAEIYKKFSKS